jgi:hypothetical protein
MYTLEHRSTSGSSGCFTRTGAKIQLEIVDEGFATLHFELSLSLKAVLTIMFVFEQHLSFAKIRLIVPCANLVSRDPRYRIDIFIRVSLYHHTIDATYWSSS